ncbi:hypothetical protein CCO03_10980 [Comamonas serinivorans]|uniref:Uncharacterized protein n=1 Tax=Comamonas serinivorans TaxID=1082851 RepID=A0A1Y0ENC7_9BURK|nr:hypothetical protein [Comamonas serinivorans]ARU05145.1 hypothetical protein CCO03_10980 [Comamonas serinivorans]
MRHHGKQRFYTVGQVRAAHQRQGISIDVACGSHAFFNTHSDFDRLHAQQGEVCDHAGMKAELAEALSPGAMHDWSLFDLFE